MVTTMLMCRCDCNRQYQTLAAMDHHRRASHVLMVTTMLMCRYGYNHQYQTLAAMDHHRRASHPNTSAGPTVVRKEPVVACNDCLQTFSSIDALRQHQLTKENHIRPARGTGSFSCASCMRTLRSSDALEQHFVANHCLNVLAEGDWWRVQLEADFSANWRKPSPPGQIVSIFKVYNPGWRTLEFQQYKQQLPNNGNEVQRYHGTTQLCDLGSSAKNTKLCQNESCNLCNILRTGFMTAKARPCWQRFGKGIYTTATSGKSNDYINSASNRRAVLVCRVLAGKVYRTFDNMPSLESPPVGYNSVCGEVGKDLNYDETVVYSSKAILPDFVIVYDI